MERRVINIGFSLLVSVIAVSIIYYLNPQIVDIYFFITFGLLFFLLLRFVHQIGKGIPILFILAISGLLQWVGISILFNGLFDYNYLDIYDKEYYNFALPGALIFIIALLLPAWQREETAYGILKEKLLSNKENNGKIGIYLFSIGLIAMLSKGYAPPQLKLSLELLKELIFVGAYFLIFSNFFFKLFFIILALLITIINSIKSGLFWPMGFWTMLSFLIIFFRYPKKKFIVIIFIVLGIFSLPFIQIIKKDFRSKTWNTSSQTSDDKFNSLVSSINESLLEDLEIKPLLAPIFIRLNQAKINSRVIKHVSEEGHYAYGKTILTAIPSLIIPRLFWPGKPVLDNSKYIRYTGHYVKKNTYMNISPVGEGYANFGWVGGWGYLFFYGLVIRYIYLGILFYGTKITSPSIILWLPLLLYGALSAESAFVDVSGYTFKAIVNYLILVLLFRLVLKIRI